MPARPASSTGSAGSTGSATSAGSTGRTSGRPLVVVVAGVNWDGVKGSERQLAEALCRYADVLWVDPPVSPVTPTRYTGGRRRGIWSSRMQVIDAQLRRFTPVALPGLARPGIRATTWPLVRAQLSRAVRRTGRRPAAVLTCHPYPALGRWARQPTVALYGTDDWVAGASLMGQDAVRLARIERAALGRADLVLAVSPELAGQWRSLGADPVVLPNGCDPAAYAEVHTCTPAEVPAGFPAPVAGMIGQLTDRIDIGLLEAVAETGIGLVLVGPRDPAWQPGRLPALLARPNVLHAGPVPFAELPRWLARIDVGLTPYADTPFNRASFPLKTLEYLAAGRPVVSTDLPATHRLAEETTHVVPAGDAESFVRAVLDAATAPRTTALVTARQEVAQRHSWAWRAQDLVRLLDLDPTESGPAESGPDEPDRS